MAKSGAGAAESGARAVEGCARTVVIGARAVEGCVRTVVIGARAKWKAALGAVAALLLWGAMSFLTGTLCVFQAFFGIPCPGCGSTRAAVALLRRHFREAFALHPLIPLSLLILPYAALRETLCRRKPIARFEKAAAVCAVALYVIVYAARMALMFPRAYPMVPNENAIWPQIIRCIVDIGHKK